eukprot:TRINITY_DN8090_c1_g1_i4.p1 TRINITY_DN8090_c1_g1~~TRINITY_DN8090_c1_g1_i4.p1  ORF type:complete len:823 (+),score=218.89 TRINITY_DN8090_c1_g1_i4:94-2562(+)
MSSSMLEQAMKKVGEGSSAAAATVELRGDPDLPLWELTVADAQRLCEAMQQRTVRSLVLSGVKLSHGAVATIAEFACAHTQLRRLDLSYSRIGGQAAASLIDTLIRGPPSRSHVSDLNLSYCNVGVACIPAMIRSLSVVSGKIQNLSLRYNPITAQGLGLLLAWACTVAVIDARHCGILSSDTEEQSGGKRAEGLRYVLDGLRQNVYCSRLLLEGNGFSSEDAAKMLEVVAANRRSQLSERAIVFGSGGGGGTALSAALARADKVNVAVAAAMRITADGDAGDAPAEADALAVVAGGEGELALLADIQRIENMHRRPAPVDPTSAPPPLPNPDPGQQMQRVSKQRRGPTPARAAGASPRQPSRVRPTRRTNLSPADRRPARNCGQRQKDAGRAQSAPPRRPEHERRKESRDKVLPPDPAWDLNVKPRQAVRRSMDGGGVDRLTPALLNACMAGDRVCAALLGLDTFAALPHGCGQDRGVPSTLLPHCGVPNTLNQLPLGCDERVGGVAKLLFFVTAGLEEGRLPGVPAGMEEQRLIDHVVAMGVRMHDPSFSAIIGREGYEQQRKTENRKARALLRRCARDAKSRGTRTSPRRSSASGDRTSDGGSCAGRGWVRGLREPSECPSPRPVPAMWWGAGGHARRPWSGMTPEPVDIRKHVRQWRSSSERHLYHARRKEEEKADRRSRPPHGLCRAAPYWYVNASPPAAAPPAVSVEWPAPAPVAAAHSRQSRSALKEELRLRAHSAPHRSPRPLGREGAAQSPRVSGRLQDPRYSPEHVAELAIACGSPRMPPGAGWVHGTPAPTQPAPRRPSMGRARRSRSTYR